jgi:protein gp37
MAMAARLQKMNPTGGSNSNYVNHYDGTTVMTKTGPVWTGKVAMAPEKILRAPLGWKSPKRIFVNSMSDLFHESIPDEWIVRVLDIIRSTGVDGGSNCGTIRGAGEHVYQVLTKRASRMAAFMTRLRFEPRGNGGLYLADDGKRPVVLKNLWLGVSVERQQEADERVPLLLRTPAAVRFVSCEPLLGPIDLTNIKPANRYECNALTGFDFDEGGVRNRLDWVIVGGESGPHARPMETAWAESIRDQCKAAGVAFFMKQMTKKRPIPQQLLIREMPHAR